MDREEYKRTSLENWEAMAPGWESARDELEAVVAPVTQRMVQALAPRPGDTVLELAAGPGGTGFAISPLLGDEGRLISSDFSPAMVDVSRRQAEKLGLANVGTRVLDAEAIALEDDSVDGVLCRFGFMLMPAPEIALAETRRVLRPGGRLVLAVWSAAARNPWVALVGRVFAELGLGEPPARGEPGMFVLADEQRLRGLLEDAGFVVEAFEEVPLAFEFADVDAYIARSNTTGGLFARTWRAASEEQREAIRGRLTTEFAPFASDRGYALPGVAIVAAAT